MELKSPREKPYWPANRPSYPPLPAVKEDLSVSDDEYFKPCFHGCFNGMSVVVDDPWEMSALHNMGFFGKGSLSRSYPKFGKRSRGLPPVLKESQWLRRQQWISQFKSLFGAVDSRASTVEPNQAQSEPSDQEQGELNLSFSPDKSICPNDFRREVIVISDNDIDSGGDIRLNPRTEIETKNIVAEVLTLTLEEAFFLSYGLGVLEMIDLTGKPLGVAESWDLFRKTQGDFVESYVAYHHFRSKGWVVKPGLKFGGKFLLYKKGPSFYHASFVVNVRTLGKPGPTEPKYTWQEFMCHNRMVESSNKEVLILFVEWPTDPSLVNSVANLREFTVRESLARRWFHGDQEIETQKDKPLKETVYDTGLK